MDGAIDLGAVRRARVELDALTRAHPELTGARGRENREGWIETMVRELERICLGCGIPFVAHRKDQRFHDARCKAQHWRDAKAAIDTPSPLENSMDLALSLYRADHRSARTLAALRALRGFLLAELAELEPSTPEPTTAAPEPTTAASSTPEPMSPEPSPEPTTAAPEPTTAASSTPEPMSPEPSPEPTTAAPEPTTAASSTPEPTTAIKAKSPAQQPLLDRTLRALNTTTKAAISKAIDVHATTIIKFVNGQRALGEELTEKLERWLTTYERKVKPR